ncbi:N-6 DNA methylase [Cloacibacterium sp.]|uniref:N-6 DNA methylase n=1 Tax=Cloacibacterium sp. TaxID=1913682 RepID=UPI0039E50FC9
MAKTDTSTFEQKLFKSADKLRKNIDAAEYKHVVLGLIFLKYISESFSEKYEELDKDEYSDPEDRDEYIAANIFFVPKDARWSHIHANAKLPTIGQTIDEAMEAIERENKELKNVLPQVYGKANLDKTSLGELIDLISNTDLQAENDNSKDLFGRVYEYFLGEFANAEGKKGGQFYTPKAIVKLMVEMIEPYKGRVYDPASGSGGMFVMSEKFVLEHRGRINDITVYGQESNQTTWKLSKMNLAIRNINSKFVAWNSEGSFLKDAHPDLKADFILANPPFNQSDWGIDILQEDGRWKYGVPPNGNANYGWLQHMLYHLSPKGVMATVLSNGSLSSNTSGEGEIRKNMILSDLVECIVALPKQLFYNTGIPACIWIMRRDKNHHNREVLFIDASEMGYMKDRVHRDLSDDDVDKIKETYHNWRKGENYHNQKGYCKSATIEEIEKHGYILTPGRYVGMEEYDNDNISFTSELICINKTLREFTNKDAELNDKISKQLNQYFPHINWDNMNFSSNEILEHTAKVIFKEWFDKYKTDDKLPEGWKVDTIGSLIDIKRGGSPRPIQDFISESGYRWLKISDATATDSPYIFRIKECIIKEGLNKTVLKKAGDLVLSNSATPGIPKFLAVDTCIHDGWLHFPSSKVSNEYLYLLFLSIRPKLVQQGSGSVFTNLKTDILRQYEIVIPDEKTFKEFDKLIKPIFERIYSNSSQIHEFIRERELQINENDLNVATIL